MTPDLNVFRFDDSGLRNLLKTMSSEHFVRIGVFGGDHKAPEKNNFGKGRQSSKKSTGLTNADIGAMCELGNRLRKRPPRSWLRMPLMTKIEAIVKDSAKSFEGSAQTGNPTQFLEQVGINAEKYIKFAFETGGFGKWAANAPSTVERKGSSAPNIDTSQLRRAVVSMVL